MHRCLSAVFYRGSPRITAIRRPDVHLEPDWGWNATSGSFSISDAAVALGTFTLPDITAVDFHAGALAWTAFSFEIPTPMPILGGTPPAFLGWGFPAQNQLKVSFADSLGGTQTSSIIGLSNETVTGYWTVTPAAVPEPATIVMLGSMFSMFVLVGGMRWRRRAA